MQTVIGRLKKFLTADWCFLGVIVYFIVHGYTENENVVPFTSLILLLTELMLIGALLFFISRRLLGNNRKASIFTSIILIIVLYFGVVQGFLLKHPMLVAFSRFRVILPLCFGIIVISFIWLKRSNDPLYKPVLFLNVLLVIYLLIDAGTLIKINFFTTKRGSTQLANFDIQGCNICQKPPVYLVLFDSYFGTQGLKDYFHYDNSRFERSLTDLGFHVIQTSVSNYKYTAFSMASMLNMQLLPNIGEPVLDNHYGYNTAIAAINGNAVCQYFARQGYKINNYSLFDIGNVPGAYNLKLLPVGKELVLSQTMYWRVKKSLLSVLAQKGWVAPETIEDDKAMVRNNTEILNKALAYAHTHDRMPAFTYVHVLMPHHPYILDSMGNYNHIIQKMSQLTRDSIDNMFLQYEVYANKVMTAFISRLQKETRGRAVLLLMSDHGYKGVVEKKGKLPFYNLNAVYLPQGNYQGWYDGMSNVNQFRILFNTLFHQHMPLLPDSLVAH